MPERLSDDQLTRLNDLVAELEAGHQYDQLPETLSWQREARSLWALNLQSVIAGYVPALLDEIDRLRAKLEEAEMEVETRGETITRLRAALRPISTGSRAENEAWAVSWQEQFDQPERAEAANSGPSQSVEPLSGELTAGTEPEAAPLSSCPHIVTDDEGTSHCSLAEGRVREVERQRDIVIEAARALADDVGTYGRGSLVGRLVEQCDRAEGKG